MIFTTLATTVHSINYMLLQTALVHTAPSVCTLVLLCRGAAATSLNTYPRRGGDKVGAQPYWATLYTPELVLCGRRIYTHQNTEMRYVACINNRMFANGFPCITGNMCTSSIARYRHQGLPPTTFELLGLARCQDTVSFVRLCPRANA